MSLVRNVKRINFVQKCHTLPKPLLIVNGAALRIGGKKEHPPIRVIPTPSTGNNMRRVATHDLQPNSPEDE